MLYINKISLVYLWCWFLFEHGLLFVIGLIVLGLIGIRVMFSLYLLDYYLFITGISGFVWNF